MDAATRFYERSHELNKALTPVEAFDATVLAKPGHRYSSAYEYLASHPGLVVAELGYGGAALIGPLATVSREYHLVDIVDRTNGSLPENAFAKVGNLDNDWPLTTGAFDVVLAMMILEHLYDPFHSFAELARILRPEGKAFVNLPNIAALKCRLQLLRGQMPVTSSNNWFDKREWDGNHLHSFTVADVHRIAHLNGLKVAEMYAVGKRLWLKRLRPSLLCHEITYVLEKR